MRLPTLRFSEYFLDHNHEHNIDDIDVSDAIRNRHVLISREFFRHGQRRRIILARNENAYMRVIVQPAETFWWVLSAYPASDWEIARARRARVGDEAP